MKSKRLHVGQCVQTSFLRRIAPVVVWAAAVFALSAVPGRAVPHVGLPSADKVIHALIYGLGAWLALRGRFGRRPWLTAWLAVAAYGVTDEWHQRFVPGRTCDVRDWVADACGAAIALTLAEVMRRRSAR